MLEENEETWRLSILRSNGMQHLRRDKAWRPIVVVSVNPDYGHNHCATYETTLGCDGQNPNSKQGLHISRHATPSTNIAFEVLYCPPSKKKARRKGITIASCVYSMRDLVKMAHEDPKPVVVLKTGNARAPRARRDSTSSNRSVQKKPDCATLQIRLARVTGDGQMLRYGLSSFEEERDSEVNSDSESSSVSDTHSITDSEQTLHDSPTLPLPSSNPDSGLRRRRRRRRQIIGFTIDSGDEAEEKWISESCSSGDESECPTSELEKRRRNSFSEGDDESSRPQEPHRPLPWFIRAVSVLGMAAPTGILPTYTVSNEIQALEAGAEKLKEEYSQMVWWERILCVFTVYRELKLAEELHSYDRIYQRLQMEWTYVGGLLVALAATDAAVFAISPDTIFAVDSVSRTVVGLSTIATAFGILCDAYFILHYAWSDVHHFVSRARSNESQSWGYFALSARIPALCMIASMGFLVVFLLLVASEAAPVGLWFLGILVGMGMWLQYLVFVVSKFMRMCRLLTMGVVDGFRGAGRQIKRVFSRKDEAATVPDPEAKKAPATTKHAQKDPDTN